MVLPFTENFWKEFMQRLLKAFCISGSMLGAVEMQEWLSWAFLSEVVLWERKVMCGNVK